MKFKLLILALSLCVATKTFAQQIYPMLTPIELKHTRLKLAQTSSNIERTQLLLKLSYHYIIKGGEYNSDLDSASFFLNRAQKLSKKFNLVRDQIHGTMLFGLLRNEKGEYDKFREILYEVISEADSRKLFHEKGEALYFLGCFDRTNELEQYKRALSCFQSSKSLKEEAYVHFSISKLYTRTSNGNKELSLQSAIKSLALYKKTKGTDLQYLYHHISNVSGSLNNWPDRVGYLLLAIDEVKRTGNSTQIGRYYSDLGGTYQGLKQHSDALKYLLLAQNRFEAQGDQNYIYYNANMICNVFSTLNQKNKAIEFYKSVIKKFPPTTSEHSIRIASHLATYYTQMKRFDLAEPYVKEMLGMEAKIGRKNFATILSYSVAVNFYLAVKDLAKAEFYLNEVSKNNATNPTSYISWTYLNHFRLDSARGNFLSAIQYYQKYKLLNDSVLNEGKLKQIAELQIQYETKKKEADLLIKDKNIFALNERTLFLDQEAKNRQTLLDKALLQSQKSDLLRKNKDAELAIRLKNIKLLKQQSELQKSQLNQAYLTRTIVICFSVLLITLLALLFRQFRLKQSANQIIAQKNDRLQSLVTEKNWLLKEVHHRVKNNLQTVISLLESQAFYLKDDAYKAMQNCQHRIYVMSLIHQKLYQSDEVKSILMPLYISEFVSYLSESLEVRQNISFQQDIDEIELNINQAVPLALIINEAVTNSIKYAFPNRQFGIIHLSLKRIADQIFLCISDNGIGITNSNLNQNTDTLGLKLMKGLCQDLNADIKIDNTNGTSIMINFEIIIPYQIELLDAV
ncbi:sensor histidine kinase [Pedobacter frigiditerrae]|uniref:histidine kinase n=1 Tax=Pedobacter frigiditerrae TaxID=2530452 RepID=A0A4V2MI10_9SPHI|nr:sensor histidine kinase [Pedobacter frigiditerrae]TCC88526.1 sensor histidine kinase [Pedobacter frigiditerrae]